MKFIKTILSKRFAHNIRIQTNYLINIFNNKKYIKTDNYEIIKKKKGSIEKIYFPKLHKINDGGYISLITNDIKLICFENAIITDGSDFIRFKDFSVYHPYFNQKVNDYFIITSPDYLKKAKNGYLLKNIKIKNKYRLAFNLVTRNRSWSHYLVLVLPKLKFIKSLNKNENYVIITNQIKDKQLIELIELEVSNFKNIEVINLKQGESVECEKLYHVELDSFICNQGFLSSPFSVLAPSFVRNYWADLKSKLIEQQQLQNKKLFLGRSGLRNISNYDEILSFFVSKGFIEVFPEEYSLIEKAKLFNSSSHIVGPASSGFTNIIFCQEGTKVISFINFARTTDTLMGSYCEENNINVELITGNDLIPEDMNSNFYIDIEIIEEYFNEDYF